MKILKRLLSLSIITFLISCILTVYSAKAIDNVFSETKPEKVTVLLLYFADVFISEIGGNLKNIQKENPGTVEFTFYDGKLDGVFQNAQLKEVLDQGLDLIGNNDAMVAGAIKALQENGYNNGDIIKTIPIVGVTQKAKELLEKGYMLGAVYQSSSDYAEALYTCGMNIIERKSPIEGTKYTLDDTRVSIRIPQTEYLYRNIFEENI